MVGRDSDERSPKLGLRRVLNQIDYKFKLIRDLDRRL